MNERPEPTELLEPLSRTQREIVAFVREHIDAHDFPPSVREIGEHVGLTSTASVHHQLRRLEKLGVILRAPKRSRAITLLDAA